MSFDPVIAAVRFGTGLSPRLPRPASVAAMLADLAGPDIIAAEIPIANFAQASPSPRTIAEATRARAQARGTAQEEARIRALRDVRQQAAKSFKEVGLRRLARGVATRDGLRERLVDFWADHFTVKARGIHRHLVASYIEEAIRPHVAGSFGDLLRAAVTHPLMLVYLQQNASVGPNSPAGQRRGRGLNENLARELLELHTVGVGGGYGQADVRELAELLTGLHYHPINGPAYDPRRAEPGVETVLGITFAPQAELATVYEALDMLARHPETALHLARKLAVHFVSDAPPDDLVRALAETFLGTQGDLLAVTEALLTAPEAWVPERQKVRRPAEFVAAALRALDVPTARLTGLSNRDAQRLIARPLRVMGQPWEAPVGPDGWEEDAAHWIIPQAMAGRITWAMQAPARLLDPLPDPREFVEAALGPRPPQAAVFAARAAEAVPDGIGVVLSTPAFHRR